MSDYSEDMSWRTAPAMKGKPSEGEAAFAGVFWFIILPTILMFLFMR